MLVVGMLQKYYTVLILNNTFILVDISVWLFLITCIIRKKKNLKINFVIEKVYVMSILYNCNVSYIK